MSPSQNMQAALAATEEGDYCAICAELEALIQTRRSLGAAAAPIGTALDYIGQGLAVVPIPHRSKRPIIEDWPNLRITEENALEHGSTARRKTSECCWVRRLAA